MTEFLDNLLMFKVFLVTIECYFEFVLIIFQNILILTFESVQEKIFHFIIANMTKTEPFHSFHADTSSGGGFT